MDFFQDILPRKGLIPETIQFRIHTVNVCPKSTKLNCRYVDFFGWNSRRICRVLYCGSEVYWSERCHGNLSSGICSVSRLVRQVRICRWTTGRELRPSFSPEYILCGFIRIQVGFSRTSLISVRKCFQHMCGVRVWESRVCWHEYVRLYCL